MRKDTIIVAYISPTVKDNDVEYSISYNVFDKKSKKEVSQGVMTRITSKEEAVKLAREYLNADRIVVEKFSVDSEGNIAFEGVERIGRDEY